MLSNTHTHTPKSPWNISPTFIYRYLFMNIHAHWYAIIRINIQKNIQHTNKSISGEWDYGDFSSSVSFCIWIFITRKKKLRYNCFSTLPIKGLVPYPAFLAYLKVSPSINTEKTDLLEIVLILITKVRKTRKMTPSFWFGNCFQKKEQKGHAVDIRYLTNQTVSAIHSPAILQLVPEQLTKSFEVPRD